MADSILALLEPGEYVINSNAAKKIGKEVLDNINYDMMPRFANGGSILGDHLQRYQTGGPVSYGGAESTLPSLEDLYKQFGVQPKEEFAGRFEEYDPSRESVYVEDYSNAMAGERQSGRQGLAQAGEAMRGSGSGFAGAGAGQAQMSSVRRSMMQDYLQGQKSAYGTLFKGIRGEREQWMKEMGAQLTTLEEAEGTRGYSSTPSYSEYTTERGQAAGEQNKESGLWGPVGSPGYGGQEGDVVKGPDGQKYRWVDDSWELFQGTPDQYTGEGTTTHDTSGGP